MSKLLAELNNPFNACAHKQQCIDKIAELEQEQQQMYSDMMTMYEIWSGVKGTQPDWAAEFFNETKANKKLQKLIAELEQELANKKKEFIRMENAWREELQTWYIGNPTKEHHPSLLASLNGKLKVCEIKNQRLRDALEEELPRLWDYYPNVARRLKKALEDS